MMRSFRNSALQQLWSAGKALEHKTLVTEIILDALYAIDAAGAPQDVAFKGFRYDEWIEDSQPRYGVMVSDHWLISFGWSGGYAIDVDLERID